MALRDDPILDLPALTLARMIATREVSSEELARGYLARVERDDPRIASFVDVAGERALDEARDADRRVRRGERLPFLGVPTAIKDLNMAKGLFTRFGSRAFENLYAVTDDRTTQHLRQGGFVVLGKTATSELGAMPVTETDIHPPARNPWDPRVTAGGSSGGAGAAVAARLVPVAQGSDGAGSIRIPACFGHVYGLKPSRGRVENSWGMPDRDILYTVGPITRFVEDAAAMLDVMSGVAFGEPHWAPPPPRSFLELSRRPVPRLRIRVTTKTPLATTEPEIADATVRVAKLLSSMGHEVEDGAEPWGTLEEFLPIWQYMASTAPVADWSEVQPITRWLAEAGRHLREDDVTALSRRLAARVLDWFGGADVWVTPTVPVWAPPIGAFRGLPPAEGFAGAARLGPFTALFNLTGQPAANIPAGISRGGLPIGVQIVARPFADALVLSLSRALEEAMPWKDTRPPRT